jgi:hypothetical protein
MIIASLRVRPLTLRLRIDQSLDRNANPLSALEK